MFTRAGAATDATTMYLIGDLFGLGSFALLVILVAVSVRLIGRKWGFSLIKTTLLTLTGTMVASLLLAFAGNLAGIPDIFGGGLGGEFGRQVVLWGNNLFGLVICGAIILLLLIFWLFFSSSRFTSWVYSLGRKDSEPRDDNDFNNAIELAATQEDIVSSEDGAGNPPEGRNTRGSIAGGPSRRDGGVSPKDELPQGEYLQQP